MTFDAFEVKDNPAPTRPLSLFCCWTLHVKAQPDAATWESQMHFVNFIKPRARIANRHWTPKLSRDKGRSTVVATHGRY